MSHQPKISTGTSRVIGEGGAVRFPGPTLPASDEQPAAKAKAKVPEKKEPPFVQVPSTFLVKVLAGNMAQNRLTRLKNLARTNRDVSWLLSEVDKNAPRIKKPKSEN